MHNGLVQAQIKQVINTFISKLFGIFGDFFSQLFIIGVQTIKGSVILPRAEFVFILFSQLGKQFSRRVVFTVVR